MNAETRWSSEGLEPLRAVSGEDEQGNVVLSIVDKDRALAVLSDIDSTYNKVEAETNKSIAHLCNLLLEAKQGAYWIERGHKTEDDYIKTLPYSRTYYYNLISVGLHLGHLPEETISQIGIKKAEALVRISKHSPSLTDEWVERAKGETLQEFTKSVREFFKKKDEATDENIEWIRVKATTEQANVIREAFKIAEQMLGSEKSQAHQLETICADFLAAHNDDGSGRLEGRAGFILSTIKRLALQLEPEVINQLVNTLATVIEEKNE